jgi:hypothetical protein
MLLLPSKTPSFVDPEEVPVLLARSTRKAGK